MTRYDSDRGLWDAIFAINYTFTGWTPQYIYWHMPVKWFRFYSERLVDVADRQQAAAKNKPYVPRKELSKARMIEQDEHIRQMIEDRDEDEL